MLLVRELLLGPRRYSDLLESLPGLTTNLLATRLKRLEAEALVVREPLVAPARGHAYALTEDGRALEPALQALAAWGMRRVDEPREGDRLDLAWGLLSMKRRFLGGPRRALLLEVRLEDEPRPRRWQMRLRGKEIEVREGVLGDPDLVLRGELMALAGWLFGGRQEAGAELEGDPADWERFRRAFAWS